MHGRTDRQSAQGGKGVTSCRHCCTPPAQCCYKRKKGNTRRTRDIKHSDVRRREGEEMLWPRVHSTDESWKSEAVGGTETVREAKVVPALLQTGRSGCWIKDGVKQNATQNTVSCRKAACTVILCIQEYGGLIIQRMSAHAHTHTNPALPLAQTHERGMKDGMRMKCEGRPGQGQAAEAFIQLEPTHTNCVCVELRINSH